MAWITEGDIEKYSLQDIDSSFSAWIISVISMVEDYIKQYTGIDFQNSATAEKYFDTFGGREAMIDGLESVTTLRILDVSGNTEETLTENTDFWLYPLNDTVKNKVVLAGGGKRGSFPNRKRGLYINGVFGYSTVPTPIQLAAIKLAWKILEKGIKGGDASKETLGSYSVEYRVIDENAEALGIKEILNLYKVMTL